MLDALTMWYYILCLELIGYKIGFTGWKAGLIYMPFSLSGQMYLWT